MSATEPFFRAERRRVENQNSAKTECPDGHAYDEANTYVDKYNRRRCRECIRLNANAQNEARRNQSREPGNEVWTPPDGTRFLVVKIDESRGRLGVRIDGPPKPAGFAWVRLQSTRTRWTKPRVVLELEITESTRPLVGEERAA